MGVDHANDATRVERAVEQLVAMLHNAPLHRTTSRSAGPKQHVFGWTPEGAAVACAAAAALGQVGGNAALEALVESLTDNGGDARARVREAAARALMAFDSPRAVDALVAALQDRDPEVRRAAVISLRCCEDQRVVAPLKLAAERDPNPGVSYHAHWTLDVLEHSPRGMAALAAKPSAQIER